MNPDDFKPEDPAHYQRGTIQVWDFIADQRLDFFAGNVVKYVVVQDTRTIKFKI